MNINRIKGVPRDSNPVLFSLQDAHEKISVKSSTKPKNSPGYNRWEVFANRELVCVACKCEAVGMVRWTTLGGEYHFDILMSNKSILTVDHRVPRCAGGSNDMSNLDPMCLICNTRKSHDDVVRQRVYLMTNGRKL